MSEIRYEDIPALLLRIVPESCDSIEAKYGVPAQQAVLGQEMALDAYEVLTECLMEPVLLPQLHGDSPDAELLERCWAFVETARTCSSDLVRGAAHFQVLEALLDEDGLVERAWPAMKEGAREEMRRILAFYGVRLPGITG
ncbi:hypothetical protein [Streptomyces sp. NPDC090029]|uniref:hypothetical protein n=1 Tax=Streptomyces sp. NPDC090029 TaxID=3365924 RepID=UPI00382EEE0C